MLRNFKVMLAVLVVLVLAGGAYAFASSNQTIPPTQAGYSTSTVSGYQVKDIVYDLNPTNPSTIDNILFTLTGTSDALVVKIQTGENVSTWKDCTAKASTGGVQAVTCNYGTPLAVVEVTQLNVVASSTIDATPVP